MKQVHMLVEKHYDYGEYDEYIIGVYENYDHAVNYMNSLQTIYEANQKIAKMCEECEYGCGTNPCCEFAEPDEVVIGDYEDEFVDCKNFRETHDTEYGIYTYNVIEEDDDDDCSL